MKRFVDVMAALIALILLFPAMLLIGLVIRWKMGSPILFKQVRPGMNARPFMLYKFRTMTDEKDEDGELLPDEQRLTSLGRFLRRYSLDELPQLWNVLKGDLSLVGPRPLLMEYLDLYTPEQARRHEVRPGLTGWAQINGRNAINWEEKLALDVWYVDHQSFRLDIKIMGITFWKVLCSDGVHRDGYATTPRFRGTISRESENR